MNLEQYATAIQKAKEELLSSLGRESAVVGADAAALVENRVVGSGKRSDGQRFSPYSTKKVAAFRYFGRSANQTGERAVRDKAKRREGISYSEFRQLNGRGVAFKNFQFTGQMWQGFGVTAVVQVSPAVFKITLGGKTERTRTLLGYHEKREGSDLTEPSKEELQQIATALEQRVIKILDKHLS